MDIEGGKKGRGGPHSAGARRAASGPYESVILGTGSSGALMSGVQVGGKGKKGQQDPEAMLGMGLEDVDESLVSRVGLVCVVRCVLISDSWNSPVDRIPNPLACCVVNASTARRGETSLHGDAASSSPVTL